MLFNQLSDHDIPLRELEYAQANFDITLDQGAYFELKRHRMMTQTVQPLSCNLGYATPALFEKAGVAAMFQADMADVIFLYNRFVIENKHLAAYLVPNAFNRRVLISANLRSLFHFIKLRSAPNAHFAIRRVALRMAESLQQIYPGFKEFFLCNSSETWQGITKEFFSETKSL
jgi:hypothetical protein